MRRRAITPWESHGGFWVKRDDLFRIGGSRGGKVRTCLFLAGRAHKGLVTACGSGSPQGNIVATVAAELGLQARVHIPETKLLQPEMERAQARGAELIRHKPGYNSVLVARAKADAETLGAGWAYVPFGMEHEEAVKQTAAQFVGAPPPESVERLVVPVGSGMSLAGIVVGALHAGWGGRILGVAVGAKDWERRMDSYVPEWRNADVEVVESPLAYKAIPEELSLDSLLLDPIYEAKCLPFLENPSSVDYPCDSRDALWVVGSRETMGVQGGAHEETEEEESDAGAA